MFARTARLTLRPGWPEDAMALIKAIGHERVAMTLARMPWPYALGDAQTFLAQSPAADEPRFLIFDRPAGQPRLVGGIGIHPHDQGHELGYWLTPDAWGCGYATEAGRAVVDIARFALGLTRLHSGHFTDNPASGRVLEKLGFMATGRAPRFCVARNREVDCELFELELSDQRDLRLAA